MNHKTIIFGNGPCACHIACDLLSLDGEVILTTRKTPDHFALDPSVIHGEGRRLEVLDGTQLTSCYGSVGNFNLVLKNRGKRIFRTVSNIIISEDPKRTPNYADYHLKPTSRLTALSAVKSKFYTRTDMEISFNNVKSTVFLTGIESESNPVIAGEVMQAAYTLQSDFGMKTYVLTNNLKVAGNGLEALYRKTKKAGVVYIKFTDTRPEIHQDREDLVRIVFVDEVTGGHFRLTPDLVIVDEKISPSDYMRELASIMNLDRDLNGFLQADNVHRLAVSTNRKGIFVAGSSRDVQSLHDQMSDAGNAALGTMNPTENENLVLFDRARIDKGACAKCLTCVRVCPHGAVLLNFRPEIEPAACECCGICVAECPCKAISMKGLDRLRITDRTQVFSEIRTKNRFTPRIVVFCCTRSAFPAGQLAKCFGIGLPDGLQLIEVPCVGSISIDHILTGFEGNADGVMVLACHEGNCRSGRGNTFSKNRITYLKGLFHKLGLQPRRLGWGTSASNMGGEFGMALHGFEKKIIEIGPSKLNRRSGNFASDINHLTSKDEYYVGTSKNN